MAIYILIVLSATLIDMAHRGNSTEQSKKKLCIRFGIILFLLAGLRSKNVGNDTWNYFNSFDDVGAMAVNKILHSDNKDVLFNVLCHYIYAIRGNFQWLLLLVSGIYTSSIMIYFYKKSPNPLMSIVVLFSFNYIQFSMTGVRQTLAMGLLTFAYMLFLDKKHKYAIPLILLAGFFHKSAWIFFAIYVLQYIKVDKQKLLFSIPVIVVVFLLKLPIANKLMFLISERGYELSTELSGGVTMFMVIFAYYILAVLYYDDVKSHSRDDIYRMMFVGLFFQALVPAQNIFFRIGMYFYFTMAILIPQLIEDISDIRSRNIVLVTVYGLLLAQYFLFTIKAAGVVPYEFFWQVS